MSRPTWSGVSEAGIGGKGKVRRLVLRDLRALAAAARKAGSPIAVHSAYRSFASQQTIYQRHVAELGEEQARLESARPGHSEHQLGTTIDFKTAGGAAPWKVADWGTTKAGRWMQANAWKFGFVMSYPKGMTAVTCFIYEPWHWRYVGREKARLIRESGLTLREWMWRQGYAA